LAASILAAARYGASNSAELAAMTVNEQIEALVLSAGDPLVDLVAPRLLGGLFGFPLLAVLGTATAALSAAGFGQPAFGIDGSAFIDARFVTHADIVSGLGKALVCGVFVPLVSAREGLSAQGGAAAVGDRTTRGVVAAVLGCLVIDFLFAVGFRLVHL
jgi:phospholipid/cholesterol/gamma-HCH transport system permease protein